MKRRFSGFTIVELVVVITLLAILAAFAIPRFINLRTQAKIAVTEGLGGGLRSALTLGHAVTFATDVAGFSTITMEGISITMRAAYPDEGISGISNALQDYTGFSTDTGLTGGKSFVDFITEGAETPATCKVRYVVADNGTSPVVTVTTTGCGDPTT